MKQVGHAVRSTHGLVVWICVAALLGAACAGTASQQPRSDPTDEAATVILVSLDGFRPDYSARFEAPHLRRLAAEGTHAPEGMIPVFPSKTFPSHYSIATGLYPEHHGIVSNTIYDPEWDSWFRFSDSSAVADARWYGGEPIWVTAEKQNVRSATFFWVGSEAPVGGVRPTYWKEFDSSIPSAERVDQVLRWLDLADGRRPALITLYFGEVDSKAHRHGPDSPQVADAVRRVDGHLGRLIRGLEQRRLLDQVHLIVVSDHGMTATSSERVIVLDDYIDLADVRIVDRSPVLMLRPRPGKLETVRKALTGAHPHLSVYPKEALPRRLHFADHRRIAPLIGLADEGWSILSSRERQDPRELPRGMHGYDNALKSMRALFVARGPRFRQGFECEPFESVHLYELMASLLGIEPAPNDGSLETVRIALEMDAPRDRLAEQTRE